jgi:hypothetical protein
VKKYVLQVPGELSKEHSDELTYQFNEWLRSHYTTMVFTGGVTVVELDVP